MKPWRLNGSRTVARRHCRHPSHAQAQCWVCLNSPASAAPSSPLAPLKVHAATPSLTPSRKHSRYNYAPASVAPSSPRGTIALSSLSSKLSSCSCSRQAEWWERSAALAASAWEMSERICGGNSRWGQEEVCGRVQQEGRGHSTRDRERACPARKGQCKAWLGIAAPLLKGAGSRVREKG